MDKNVKSNASEVKEPEFSIEGFREVLGNKYWCMFWAIFYLPVCALSMWISKTGPIQLRILLAFVTALMVISRLILLSINGGVII